MASQEKSDELPKVGEWWLEDDQCPDEAVRVGQIDFSSDWPYVSYSIHSTCGLSGVDRTSLRRFIDSYRKATEEELALFLLKKEYQDGT